MVFDYRLVVLYYHLDVRMKVTNPPHAHNFGIVSNRLSDITQDIHIKPVLSFLKVILLSSTLTSQGLS